MKIISSKKAYSCRLFTVTEDQAVDTKTKFEIKRSVVRHNGSAVMMAVDDKKRILLVRQYRLPANKYLWELPAGKVDEGETPLQAARRELIEETGYRAKRWSHHCNYYASPGFLTETMTILLAEGLTQGEAAPEDDEKIELHMTPLSEVLRLIRAGKIEDGKTLIGVLIYDDLWRSKSAKS